MPMFPFLNVSRKLANKHSKMNCCCVNQKNTPCAVIYDFWRKRITIAKGMRHSTLLHTETDPWFKFLDEKKKR